MGLVSAQIERDGTARSDALAAVAHSGHSQVPTAVDILVISHESDIIVVPY